MIGWLLKLATGNPLAMIWIAGGIAIASFAAGGTAAWIVQGWRIEANESKWQTREAKINSESAKKIQEANDRVRGIEQDIAQLLASESEGYQRKLKEKDDALNIALDSFATVGLFSHGPACPPTGGNAASGITSPAGGHNGATGRQLLGKDDSIFLLTEASRADKIVEQLTACQGVIRTDRVRK